MKVKELIKKLQNFDPELEVYTDGDGSADGHPSRASIIKIDYVGRTESHYDKIKGLGPSTLCWASSNDASKEVVYIGHDLKNWFKEEIKYHKNLYKGGTPEISDKAYDRLIESYKDHFDE